MSIFYLLLIGRTQIADHTIEEKVYVFTQKQLSHMYWHRIMHFSKRHLLNLFLLYSSLQFTFFMTKILFTSNIIYILIWHFFSPWVMMCEYVWERKRLWLMYFPLESDSKKKLYLDFLIAWYHLYPLFQGFKGSTMPKC